MYPVRFIGMNALSRERFLVESGEYDFHNLFLVAEGSFFLNGETVLPGDVAVFAPHVPFFRRVLTPIRFLSIHFAADATLPCGILRFRDRARVLSTAELLKAAAAAPDAQLLRSHLLADLFAQHAVEALRPLREAAHSPIVSRALAALDADEAPDIATLAHGLGISHSYLIRLFRRELGQTPQGYLIAQRIARARALLCDTALELCEIAQRCGFDNVYYFGNAFKKHTGLSPGKFREIYRI